MATPIPTIHLNGSSGENLRNETRNAYLAVCAAIDELCTAAPNARDYYPQGPAAWPAADDAHRSRLERLIAVRDELSELYRGIHDQLDERAARSRR